MKFTRAAFLILIVAAVSLLFAGQAQAGFTSQRAQISIAIIVQVTPAAGYHPTDQQVPAMIARIGMHREGRGSSRDVDTRVQTQSMVAQSIQKTLKVEAQVTPNPNATLLYSDSATVTLTGTAGGAPVRQICAYHVTVDRSPGLTWTLDDGLSNDFSTTYNGNNLAHNTYPTPGPANPTSTPFLVWPDDGNKWYPLPANSGNVTYCVDLTLTIPASVPGGTYSTNAVYTLFF